MPLMSTFAAFRLVPLAIAVAFALSAVGQDQEGASGGAGREESLPDLKPIQADLVEIRELEFKQDVPASKQSLDDFKAYMLKDIEEMFPAERFDDVMEGLLRLGMLEQKIDLGESFINAVLSQAAAYYDPETDRFYYLMSDMDPQLLEVTAAHELVHALQDQHFDLGGKMDQFMAMFEGDAARNDDAILAFRCLVEGEATYVHTIWQMKQQGMPLSREMEAMSLGMMANMDIEQLATMAKMMGGAEGAMGEALQQLDEIPPYILGPLYAAYMKGAYFTMKLRHGGGWESVAAAYEKLPLSSEQCLHPEKYLAPGRDDPTRFDPALCDFLENEGWTKLDAAVHGELYLMLLLRQFDVNRGRAIRATEGWDGDLYKAWRNEDGDVLIALATTWDSEKDALEFFETYRDAISQKYPNFSNPTSEQTRYEFDCGENLGRGAIVLRDREVFVVEGADAATIDRVMEALAAVEIDHVN